jgi:biopolymer transport protein ExbB
MNIDLIFGKMAALGAGWVLWALLVLSVTGIAIIVERAVCFYSTRDDIQSLSAELGRLVFARQWRRAEKLLSESPSFEARVALAAMGQEDPHSADQLMLGASQNARLELERNLAFLGTVGSNAPFVGLLGTVIGIIGAFRKLDQSRGAWTDGLMSEIGEALIATAVGLLVALPAIAAFNVFRGVVQTRLVRADALRRVVLGQLHAQREA